MTKIASILALVFACVAMADGAPVVTLKKRDKTITIKTTSEGKLYTIKDKKGTVLAEDMTEEQLAAAHKDLHNLVNEGVAGKQYLDATNDAGKPETGSKKP